MTKGILSWLVLSFVYIQVQLSYAQHHQWVKGNHGFTYKINDKVLPWLDAKEECEKRSGTLVTIENDELSDFVKNLLKDESPSLFWTGLSEDLYKTWSWENGIGHPVFTNWLPGQPYNEEGVPGCAVVDSKGAWQVSHCETGRKSICQKKDNGIDDDDDDDLADHNKIGTKKETMIVDEVANDITVEKMMAKLNKEPSIRDLLDNTQTITKRKKINKEEPEKQGESNLTQAATSRHKNRKQSQNNRGTHGAKLKEHKNTFVWNSEANLDKENMALLRQNLKEFSFSPILSQQYAPNRNKRRKNISPTTGWKRNKLQGTASGRISIDAVGGTQTKPGKCVIPFIYNGYTHFNCLPSRKEGRKRWCAVSNNYDRDALWGYCLDNSDPRDSEANTKNTRKITRLVLSLDNMNKLDDRDDKRTGNNGTSNNTEKKQTDLAPRKSLGEIKNMIEKVLESQGLSKDEEKQVLGDLGKSKGVSPLSDALGKTSLVAEIGSLEDEEAKLLQEEAKIFNDGADEIGEKSSNGAQSIVYDDDDKPDVTYKEQSAITNKNKTATNNASNANSNKSLDEDDIQNPMTNNTEGNIKAQNLLENSNKKLIEFNILDYQKSSEKEDGIKSIKNKTLGGETMMSPNASPTAGQQKSSKPTQNKPTKEQRDVELVYDFFKKYIPDLQQPALQLHIPVTIKLDANKQMLPVTQSHNSNKQIMTEGGLDSGKVCVFPFIYEGATYWDCIEVNSIGKPWCSTSPSHSFDANPRWGYCKREKFHKNPTVKESSTDANSYNKNVQTEPTVQTTQASAEAVDLNKEVTKQQPQQAANATQELSESTLAKILESKIVGPLQSERKKYLHTSGEEFLSTDSGLKTYAGNGKRARCAIPFIFDGKTHSQCIMLDDEESWCSTTHNYDKNMKWGKCCTPKKCGQDWAN